MQEEEIDFFEQKKDEEKTASQIYSVDRSRSIFELIEERKWEVAYHIILMKYIKHRELRIRTPRKPFWATEKSVLIAIQWTQCEDIADQSEWQNPCNVQCERPYICDVWKNTRRLVWTNWGVVQVQLLRRFLAQEAEALQFLWWVELQQMSFQAEALPCSTQ